MPRPIEDLVGDFNKFGILVDEWWPETYRNKAQNTLALVAGRTGGAFFAKHLPTALAFSWEIPR